MASFENAYALVIGVGDYLVQPTPNSRGFSNLPATVDDARAIAATLTDPALCGYDANNVILLTDTDAEVENVRSALSFLERTTNTGSTVVVYFSGHGALMLENNAWHAFLCPREADPNKLTVTAISGAEFSGLLSGIPASKLLVMLDACHAGGSADVKAAHGAGWKTGLSEDYYEELSRGSGRVVIASSKEDQKSYVRKQGDFSLFTWHLLQALKGNAAVRADGFVRVLDAFHYVNELVQADEPRQTPILKIMDLDLNFPIARATGRQAYHQRVEMPEVAEIRERIIQDPIAGAKALSDYLSTQSELSARRNDVDLKRSELERIQHDLDLFGYSSDSKAAQNRTIFFLLRVCLELELGDGEYGL